MKIISNQEMLELRGKVAECYVECFDRMFYILFKSDVTKKVYINYRK